MAEPSEDQEYKIFLLKPSAIPRAMVRDYPDGIEISEDGGKTWGRIPFNLLQGTVPIK